HRRFRGTGERGDSWIRHPEALRLPELGRSERVDVPASQCLGALYHFGDLIDEPWIDRGRFRDPIDAVPRQQRPFHQVQPILSTIAERLEHVPLEVRDVTSPEVETRLLDASPRLPERLLEGAADRHGLADR